MGRWVLGGCVGVWVCGCCSSITLLLEVKEDFLPFWVASGTIRVEARGAEAGHGQLVTRWVGRGQVGSGLVGQEAGLSFQCCLGQCPSFLSQASIARATRFIRIVAYCVITSGQYAAGMIVHGSIT